VKCSGSGSDSDGSIIGRKKKKAEDSENDGLSDIETGEVQGIPILVYCNNTVIDLLAVNYVVLWTNQCCGPYQQPITQIVSKQQFYYNLNNKHVIFFSKFVVIARLYF